MKYLVETNGHYALHDTLAHQTAQAFRPTVVEATAFINSMKGEKLTVIEVLADDASDETLAKAKSRDELAEAIAALPRPEKGDAPKTEEPKPDPLDHDGNGKKGGSRPKNKRA